MHARLELQIHCYDHWLGSYGKGKELFRGLRFKFKLAIRAAMTTGSRFIARMFWLLSKDEASDTYQYIDENVVNAWCDEIPGAMTGRLIVSHSA